MKSRGSHPLHTEIYRELKVLWPCQYDWELNKILPKGPAAERTAEFKMTFNKALPVQKSTSPVSGLQVAIAGLAAWAKPRVIPLSLLLCPQYQLSLPHLIFHQGNKEGLWPADLSINTEYLKVTGLDLISVRICLPLFCLVLKGYAVIKELNGKKSQPRCVFRLSLSLSLLGLCLIMTTCIKSHLKMFPGPSPWGTKQKNNKVLDPD